MFDLESRLDSMHFSGTVAMLVHLETGLSVSWEEHNILACRVDTIMIVVYTSLCERMTVAK